MNEATLDAVVAGEMLWDLVAPGEASLAATSRLELRIGGGASNVAIALARAGLQVALAGSVGRDVLSDAFLARMTAAKVDVSRVTRHDRPMGVVFIEPASSRVLGYRPDEGASGEIVELPSTRALVLTGVTPANADAFIRSARAARARGAQVVLDLNARPRMFRGVSRLDGLRELVGAADVVKASRDDLDALCTSSDELRAFAPANGVVVVTRGADAASAFGAFGYVEVPPPRAIPRVWSGGAGDAFVAALVGSLLTAREQAWAARLELAHAEAIALLEA